MLATSVLPLLTSKLDLQRSATKISVGQCVHSTGSVQRVLISNESVAAHHLHIHKRTNLREVGLNHLTRCFVTQRSDEKLVWLCRLRSICSLSTLFSSRRRGTVLDRSVEVLGWGSSVWVFVGHCCLRKREKGCANKMGKYPDGLVCAGFL